MQDFFIPTADASRLLGMSRPNTLALSRLNIPHKRDFTHLLWSRNAVYAELKRRRALSHPPPGFLTVADAAERMGRTLSFTYHLLSKHNIATSTTTLWVKNHYRKVKIIPIKAVNKIIAEIRFQKNSFPPEGWLEINDCAEYLNYHPATIRALCKKHNVRLRKLRHAKILYNEDDIVNLRRKIRANRRRLSPPSQKTKTGESVNS